MLDVSANWAPELKMPVATMGAGLPAPDVAVFVLAGIAEQTPSTQERVYVVVASVRDRDTDSLSDGEYDSLSDGERDSLSDGVAVDVDVDVVVDVDVDADVDADVDVDVDVDVDAVVGDSVTTPHPAAGSQLVVFVSTLTVSAGLGVVVGPDTLVLAGAVVPAAFSDSEGQYSFS